MAAFKKSYGIGARRRSPLSHLMESSSPHRPESSGIGRRPGLERDPTAIDQPARDVSNGQSYTVSATINVNFDTSSAEAIVQFPLLSPRRRSNCGWSVTTSTPRRRYLVGKWLEIDEHPRRSRYCARLTQPASDLNLIKGFNTSRSRRADIQRPIASRATTSRSPMCSARQADGPRLAPHHGDDGASGEVTGRR